MTTTKVGTLEAIALITISIINHFISTLPKTIIKSCGSASVLNIVYLCILIALLTVIVIRVFKNFPNSDIIDLSEFLGGKILKTLVAFLYFIFFVGTAGIILRNFSEGLRLTYFSNYPIALILLLFCIVIAFANYFHHRSIIKSNLVIAPIMLISLLVPLFSLSPNFAYQRIFPVFGYGLNETFLTGATNLFAFSGLSIIFFLPPLLEKKEDFKKVTNISVVITGIFLVVSVGSLLCSLPFVFSVEELSPTYLMIRSFKFGTFFQRPEALFTLVWILSVISFICVFAMFSIVILPKVLNLKNGKELSSCISFIILIASLIPKNLAQTNFLESVIYKYYTLGLIFVLSFIILILCHFKKKRQDRISKGGKLLNER